MPTQHAPHRSPAASRFRPIVLALLFVSSVVLPSLSAAQPVRAEDMATPTSQMGQTSRLGEMLGRLPNLPLGTNEQLGAYGATVIFGDVALQAATLGVDPPRGDDDVAGQKRWFRAAGPLMLSYDASHWARPEWRELFGFDLFQVDQAAEYAASPLTVTVLRGRFDPNELRTAWTRRGYQPVDLGAGEAYAVPATQEAMDLNDPGDRMAGASLNVVAIADDGSLVYGSNRQAVQLALGAISGQFLSFADRADIASLVGAAPQNLATAIFVPGEVLQAPSDVEKEPYAGETAETFATRVAAEEAEAQRLPPVGTALLGQTTSTPPTDAPAGTPEVADTRSFPEPDAFVVALAMRREQAASTAAAVIAQRLATQPAPPSIRDYVNGGFWSDIFPQRTVQAMPGGAVLIELVPSPDGVSFYFFKDLVVGGIPGFLGWGP